MDIAETVGAASSAAGLKYVLEGFGYVLQKPRLAWLLVLVGAIEFFGWPFLSLMPAFAHDVLDVRERGYRVLLSATAFGALGAALTVAAFGSIERRRGFTATGVFTVAAMLLALLWLSRRQKVDVSGVEPPIEAADIGAEANRA